MRKRLAILTIAAITALSAIGAASGAITRPSPGPNSGFCPPSELTCKM
jgi:hypothetical protein